MRGNETSSGGRVSVEFQKSGKQNLLDNESNSIDSSEMERERSRWRAASEASSSFVNNAWSSIKRFYSRAIESCFGKGTRCLEELDEVEIDSPAFTPKTSLAFDKFAFENRITKIQDAIKERVTTWVGPLYANHKRLPLPINGPKTQVKYKYVRPQSPMDNSPPAREEFHKGEVQTEHSKSDKEVRVLPEEMCKKTLFPSADEPPKFLEENKFELKDRESVSPFKSSTTTQEEKPPPPRQRVSIDKTDSKPKKLMVETIPASNSSDSDEFYDASEFPLWSDTE